jgi:hypothetical protein
VPRGMTSAGGMYGPTRTFVFLDREVLHPRIGNANLRGARDNGGRP